MAFLTCRVSLLFSEQFSKHPKVFSCYAESIFWQLCLLLLMFWVASILWNKSCKRIRDAIVGKKKVAVVYKMEMVILVQASAGTTLSKMGVPYKDQL